MNVADILKQLLAIADSNGVPTGARPISLEVSAHDDEPGRSMVLVQHATGHRLGMSIPGEVSEEDQQLLMALLRTVAAFRNEVGDLAVY